MFVSFELRFTLYSKFLSIKWIERNMPSFAKHNLTPKWFQSTKRFETNKKSAFNKSDSSKFLILFSCMMKWNKIKSKKKDLNKYTTENMEQGILIRFLDEIYFFSFCDVYLYDGDLVCMNIVSNTRWTLPIVCQGFFIKKRRKLICFFIFIISGLVCVCVCVSHVLGVGFI